MTQTAEKTPLEAWMDESMEHTRSVREWYSLPENDGRAIGLALTLIEQAIDLYNQRQDYHHPIFQHVARGWWYEACCLPTGHFLDLHKALTLSGIHAPAMKF